MLRAIMHRKVLYPALIVVIAAFAIVGLSLPKTGVTASASQQTVVALVSPGEVHPGELVQVKLVVRNARNLAGFQSTVRVDNPNTRVTGAIIEKGLTRGGRDMLQLGPVIRDNSVVIGAATCPVAECSTTQRSSARRIPQGISGGVELGIIELIAGPAGQYNLTLEGVQLVDPQGNLLDATVEHLVLEVTDQ